MYKLFVSGFPLEITELELAQLFAPHGDISTIKIVRDRKTRICKGYAFIEMQTFEDAVNASEALNGAQSGDRYLTVNHVEEKPAPPVFKRPSSSFQERPARFTKAVPPSTDFKKKRPRKTL